MAQVEEVLRGERGERATDHFDSLFHPDQAQAAVVSGQERRVDVEGFAIINDFQANAPR